MQTFGLNGQFARKWSAAPQTDPDELFRRIVYIAPPSIGLGEAA